MEKPSTEEQINFYMDRDLKEALKARAQQEGTTIKGLINEILGQDMARHRGEVIEQQSLPVIREMVQGEIRKALAQQLTEFRQEVQDEIIDTMKWLTKKTDNRLAGLVVRAVRDSSINRYLLFALLAKWHGTEFAQDAYADAKTKAGKELSSRVRPKELDNAMAQMHDPDVSEEVN
ncbi:MAG: hypothetical protein J2P37_25525 [Ktedonobacteraceae bacterium]|nr:hypothetical protein [Ktedonobacteraceae bacterium]